MIHPPVASSSEISRSFSLADMDRYRAVTDMRFDWRSDFVSCDMVFWRAPGWKDVEEEVDARERLEAGWSVVVTDIAADAAGVEDVEDVYTGSNATQPSSMAIASYNGNQISAGRATA